MTKEMKGYFIKADAGHGVVLEGVVQALGAQEEGP